jgi:hypothetical protein
VRVAGIEKIAIGYHKITARLNMKTTAGRNYENKTGIVNKIQQELSFMACASS